MTTDMRTTVVEEAARLLREQGADAVTTRAVARAAGVQPPALYRLFGDKDGLLDAVAEHVLVTYVAAKDAEADDADPVAALRAAWQRHIAFGVANGALFGLLAAPGRAASPAAEAGLAVLRGRIRRIAAAGRLRVSEQRAVQLVHAAGTGAILTLLAVDPDNRDLSLAAAMFDAVAAQVLTDADADARAASDDETPAAPRGGTPVDTTPPGGGLGASGDAAPERSGGATTAATAAITLRARLDELAALTPAERALLADWLDRIATAPHA